MKEKENRKNTKSSHQASKTRAEHETNGTEAEQEKSRRWDDGIASASNFQTQRHTMKKGKMRKMVAFEKKQQQKEEEGRKRKKSLSSSRIESTMLK